MQQAATEKVCVGAGKTARFSVPLPSTASFNRLLPMPWRFAVAQAGQKRDPGLEIAGNPVNTDLDGRGMLVGVGGTPARVGRSFARLFCCPL